MEQKFISAAVLVHFAGILHMCGYLSRDQLVLRTFLLLGTFFYIGYYVFRIGDPLWEAIFWSSVFAASNAYMIASIVLDRRQYTLSADEQRLYSAFSTLSPGQFRRLMNAGKWITASERTLLTREGERPDALFFVLDGVVTIKKGNRRFDVSPGLFIGEIAWLLQTLATATVEVEVGARYVEWDVAALKSLLGRSPDLRFALESLLNRDLAGKVGKG